MNQIPIFTKIKFCGIKTIEDAKTATSLGVDALGLLMGEKHNGNGYFVNPYIGNSIANQIGLFTAPVMVTHEEGFEEISDLVKISGISTLQFHGDHNITTIGAIKKRFPYLKIYRGFHVDERPTSDILAQITEFIPYIDGVLLDSVNKQTNQVGGTGQTHDWSKSKEVVEKIQYNDSTVLRRPVILAGGLKPENIYEALAQVKPFGVDANTGVTIIGSSDKKKDYQKMQDFVSEVRRYDINRMQKKF